MLGYCYIKPTTQTAMQIQQIMRMVGISGGISKDDLHVTISHDSDNPLKEEPKQTTTRYWGQVVEVTTLGAEDSPWRAIVLKMNSPSISKTHDHFKSLGIKHSYEEFIPHISVKYKPTEEDLVKLDEISVRVKGMILFFDSQEFWEKVNGQ